MWGAAIVAAAMVSGAAAQSVEEVGLKMKEAGELLNGKQFVQAIPVLEEVIRMGQEAGADAADIVAEAQKYLPTCYQQKGSNLYKAKDLNGAIEAFQQAADLAELQGNIMLSKKMSRTISQLYMGLGVNSFNAKDYAKALESFQKGIEQDPNNIQLVSYTAKSYAELGNLEQAVALYRQVIAAGAENSKFAELGSAAQGDLNNYLLAAMSEAAQAGDVEKAQSYAEMIPENADAGLMLIQVANNRKKYDIVVANGPAAYEAQTDDAKKADIAYLLGVAYQNRGNNAKAIEWLKRVNAGGNAAAAKALATELAAQ